MTTPLPPAAPPLVAWRCFPWDPSAGDGEPFSVPHRPLGQRTGRFDLDDQPSILYLSDDGAHAVAEALQAFRNLPFVPGMLRKHGHGLALAEVRLADVAGRVADLCDPATLLRLAITPDVTAHHDRAVTQPLARRIHEAPERYVGLRWWSVFTGAWHTLAFFTDRLDAAGLSFRQPRVLTAADAEVSAARQMLNLR